METDVTRGTKKPRDGVAGRLRPDERLFRELAGRHGDYYLGIRRRMESSGNAPIWNWWAFFLNIVWFLMKRMWGAAIVITAAFGLFYLVFTQYVLTGVLVPAWASPEAAYAAILLLNLALLLGVPLFSGLFANTLYVKFLDARIRARLNRKA
ncbi:MAG: DUF2628 domain-containing protein [Alphaproteobacteria bacterium]|jgi:hypothetical protein|nr:DUF2628 domain-containing protein [Alphaproteobacteria bacterium]